MVVRDGHAGEVAVARGVPSPVPPRERRPDKMRSRESSPEEDTVTNCLTCSRREQGHGPAGDWTRRLRLRLCGEARVRSSSHESFAAKPQEPSWRQALHERTACTLPRDGQYRTSWCPQRPRAGTSIRRVSGRTSTARFLPTGQLDGVVHHVGGLGRSARRTYVEGSGSSTATASHDVERRHRPRSCRL